jgi:hypothetical protein
MVLAILPISGMSQPLSSFPILPEPDSQALVFGPSAGFEFAEKPSSCRHIASRVVNSQADTLLS